MRKILVPFALVGLCSLPLVACEVEGEDEDATSNTGNTNTTEDEDTTVTPEDHYAIIVDDSVQFPEHRADGGNPCATSGSGAHGADIDALELVKDDVVYTAFSVNYQPGTQCDIADSHDNSDDVKGAPDGTLNEGYVSLGGGSVTVTFDSSRILIEPGDEVTVYEIGDTFCTGIQGCVGDEEYSVFLATELSCEKDTAGCDVVSISDEAGGEATVTVPSF